MAFYLSEVMAWQSTHTFGSYSTQAAGFPTANLKSPNLGLSYRDTSSASPLGFTWELGGASVTAWAMALAGIELAIVGERKVSFQMTTDATWTGANIVANSGTLRSVDPDVMYVYTATADLERVDSMFVCGVDASTPTVTGTPVGVAHGAGRVLWYHTAAMPSGYHAAKFFGLGVNLLTFPDPASIAVRRVRQRHGTGWELALGWNFMPEKTVAGVAGGIEMSNLAALCAERPVMACFSGVGTNTAGVPTGTEVSPWKRLGLARIVSYNAPNFVGPVGTQLVNFSRNLTLRTWEEQPVEIPT